MTYPSTDEVERALVVLREGAVEHLCNNGPGIYVCMYVYIETIPASKPLLASIHVSDACFSDNSSLTPPCRGCCSWVTSVLRLCGLMTDLCCRAIRGLLTYLCILSLLCHCVLLPAVPTLKASAEQSWIIPGESYHFFRFHNHMQCVHILIHIRVAYIHRYRAHLCML